jgi:hypothetical protein
VAAKAMDAETDESVREEWQCASQHAAVMRREGGASGTP